MDGLQRQYYLECLKNIENAWRKATVAASIPHVVEAAFQECFNRINPQNAVGTEAYKGFIDEAYRGLVAAADSSAANENGALDEACIAEHVAHVFGQGVETALEHARTGVLRQFKAHFDGLPAAGVDVRRERERLAASTRAEVDEAFAACRAKLEKLNSHLRRSIVAAGRSLLLDRPQSPFYLAAAPSAGSAEPVTDVERLRYALHARDEVAPEHSPYRPADVGTLRRRIAAAQEIRIPDTADAEETRLSDSARKYVDVLGKALSVRQEVETAIAQGGQRMSRHAVRQSLMTIGPGQLGATALFLCNAAFGRVLRAESLIGAGGMVASAAAGVAAAERKAMYAYRRAMRDDEAHETINDPRSPIGAMRAQLRARYGERWIFVFERWATRPRSVPLTVAFRAANATRTKLNRALRLDLMETQDVPRCEDGHDATSEDYRRAAVEESRDQLEFIYKAETTALREHVAFATELDAENDLDPGVRCLSAVHTMEIDPIVQAYGSYLQSRPRLMDEKDASARADKLLKTQFPSYIASNQRNSNNVRSPLTSQSGQQGALA